MPITYNGPFDVTVNTSGIFGGNNGLSLSIADANKLVLGQDIGQTGNPAALLSNREIPLDGFFLQLTPISPTGQEYLRVANPAPTFVGKVPWQQIATIAANGDGTYNTPMILGWNPFRQFDSSQPGQHLSMEPYYAPGPGDLWKEFHYQIDLPNGDSMRLFSSTFKDIGTAATSTNQWDFRANLFRIALLNDTDVAGISPGNFSLTGQHPAIVLSDTTAGYNVTIQSLGSDLTELRNSGLFITKASQGRNLTLAQDGPSLQAAISFFKTSGDQFYLVQAAATATVFPNDFYTFNPVNGTFPLRLVNSGSVVINSALATADNGYALQVNGALTLASTAPPGGTTAGALEFDGTDLFFTKVATREAVLIGNSGAAAPATTPGVAITNFYGTSATNFLGQPNNWVAVKIGATTFKIPLYM